MADSAEVLTSNFQTFTDVAHVRKKTHTSIAEQENQNVKHIQALYVVITLAYSLTDSLVGMKVKSILFTLPETTTMQSNYLKLKKTYN